jgi:predicted nucleic acid-binding protein
MTTISTPRANAMARNRIFVDTSAWYAIIDKNDRDHAVAVTKIQILDRPLITSNYILDEILTLLKTRLGSGIAIPFGQKLWNQEVSALARITEADEEKAWEVFRQYQDKGFSFTDCTSFALMKRLEINTVFAFDDHFVQYGEFVVL